MIASWQESYDKLRQCVEKQRHYSSDKGPLYSRLWSSQWSHMTVRTGPKKAEHQRIDAFKLLKVPWTSSRSNQSILREINTEYSLEELMLKLKLFYFGHRMRTDGSLEKSLMLGKIEGRRRRGHQRMRRLNGITDAMDMNLDNLQEMVRDRKA